MRASAEALVRQDDGPRLVDVPDDCLPDRGQAFRAQRGHLEEPEQVLLLQRREVEAEAGHVWGGSPAPPPNGEKQPRAPPLPCALIKKIPGGKRLAPPPAARQGE